MNEDEIKGPANEGVGKVKDAVGGLTGDTSMQADGKLDQTAGNIQGKFGAAREQLGNAASDIADKALEFGDQAGSVMRDAAQIVRRETGHAGEKAYDAGVRASQYVERMAKEQPLLSLFGVAAIGYAIGFLLHSPMSPLVPKPKTRRYFR
jgi:uncharacterized protein YjbJ (UPF0337 family)